MFCFHLFLGLGRLLSAAVESWCLPEAHGPCRLSGGVLEGGSGAATAGAIYYRRRWKEQEYEGLCSLISLVIEREEALFIYLLIYLFS